jgi:hypothetical protein
MAGLGGASSGIVAGALSWASTVVEVACLPLRFSSLVLGVLAGVIVGSIGDSGGGGISVPSVMLPKSRLRAGSTKRELPTLLFCCEDMVHRLLSSPIMMLKRGPRPAGQLTMLCADHRWRGTQAPWQSRSPWSIPPYNLED